MIDFAAPPPIGTLLMLDDQAYELSRTKPHVRKDGAATTLLEWETACPKCGAPFAITTGLKSGLINRRCETCRKVGKPVKGKRGRRVRVRILVP